MIKPATKIIFKGNKNLFYLSDEINLALYRIANVDSQTSKNCIIDIYKASNSNAKSNINNKQLIIYHFNNKTNKVEQLSRDLFYKNVLKTTHPNDIVLLDQILSTLKQYLNNNGFKTNKGYGKFISIEENVFLIGVNIGIEEATDLLNSKLNKVLNIKIEKFPSVARGLFYPIKSSNRIRVLYSDRGGYYPLRFNYFTDNDKYRYVDLDEFIDESNPLKDFYKNLHYFKSESFLNRASDKKTQELIVNKINEIINSVKQIEPELITAIKNYNKLLSKMIVDNKIITSKISSEYVNKLMESYKTMRNYAKTLYYYDISDTISIETFKKEYLESKEQKVEKMKSKIEKAIDSFTKKEFTIQDFIKYKNLDSFCKDIYGKSSDELLKSGVDINEIKQQLKNNLEELIKYYVNNFSNKNDKLIYYNGSEPDYKLIETLMTNKIKEYISELNK